MLNCVDGEISTARYCIQTAIAPMAAWIPKQWLLLIGGSHCLVDSFFHPAQLIIKLSQLVFAGPQFELWAIHQALAEIQTMYGQMYCVFDGCQTEQNVKGNVTTIDMDINKPFFFFFEYGRCKKVLNFYWCLCPHFHLRKSINWIGSKVKSPQKGKQTAFKFQQRY